MEKIRNYTPDLAEENYKKLAELFPNAVTETKDEEGNTVRAIDADVLRQEISATVVEGDQERYQFTWPDKRKSVVLANSPISKTLRFEQEKSVGRDGTPGGTDSENIYIEGDNLDALKLLQETYLGKVKMIYIDPPYNTGSDAFVYNDDFRTTHEKFSEVSGQRDENGNVLFDMHPNNETNGRFHSDWLNMLYPRIRIAKDLLSRDGVIFISIDDNEQANLKKVCDEIFGRSNFIGMLILKTATDNNPSQINTEHEYMMCYAKDKNQQDNWLRTSEAAKRIIEKYRELKEKELSVDEIQTELRKWIKANKESLPQVAHYNCVDNKGVYSSSGNSSNPHPGGYMYDIIHPITGLPVPKPQNGWRWPERTFLKYAADGEVEWGNDESTQPHIKKRIETAVDYLRSLIYEDNRATTKMLADLFDGQKVFDNPKPMAVLARIIDYVTTTDSIILDFFSGSATTAHSVMKLNSYDDGHRKFVLVQLQEKTDEKSEANKVGYKTICDIGEERIRRAGKKIKEETGADIDYGFRCFKVDSTNMEDVFQRPADLSQDQLSLFDSNIKQDRTPEDLLIQVMLDLGALLSSKIEEIDIKGKRVFSVSDGYLLACFDEKVDEDVVTEIAQKKPYYAVFRDSSMADDSVAANFEQIFATYSPQTVRKVL